MDCRVKPGNDSSGSDQSAEPNQTAYFPSPVSLMNATLRFASVA
jgi:hypothetical protein